MLISALALGLAFSSVASAAHKPCGKAHQPKCHRPAAVAAVAKPKPKPPLAQY